MTKRKERSLKELYFLTDRLSEPEITPVLRGIFRIQGPVDEVEHDKGRNTEPSPVKKKIRKGSTDDSLKIIEEPGKCNMCAAPCTSCTHCSRTVSFMESKIEDELPGEICKGKKATYYSSSDAEVPLFKSRASAQQRAASETSNLFSASSSRDSFSENAESKATVKTLDAAEVFDNVESGRTIDGHELHAKQFKVAAQGVSVSSHKGIPLDVGQKTSRQYEEQQRLECHDDVLSCVTGVKDENEPVSDNNVDSDRKNVSAVGSNSPAEGFEKAVQQQTQPDFITGCQCESEESQRSSSRSTSCTKHSFRDTSGITPGTVGFSHKSDPSELPSSNDFNVINSTPKLQPPYNHSQSGNKLFGCEYSKDSGENSNNLPQEEPSAECSMEHVESSLVGAVGTSSANGHKFAALDSGDVLPNNEDSKASLTRNNSSDALMKIHPCQETDIAVESDKALETSAKSSVLNHQFEESTSSLKPTDRQEHPLQAQLISKIEHSASDTLEDDVKVCDICGDTGREEMLATCSRCNDGAEHTYCMRITLDKVPESDWLCEECQLKEDYEKRKLVKTEVVSETPLASSLNENELLPKLKNRAQEAETSQGIKAITTPKVSTKRHAENMEVASSSGSPGAASSGKRAAPSRESSFKNLNVVRVNLVHPLASPISHCANSSQEITHLRPASSPCASRMQEQRQGFLSRPATFNNSKPKVKEIYEYVSQKQKLTGEFANGSTRKEGLIRTFSKNLSFKSTISGLSNTNESDAKLQSAISSWSEDSRGLKQGIKQNIIERKKSFRSDRPVVNPSPTAGTITSLTKGAQHDGRLCTSSKSTISVARKGSENMAASDGSGDVKKQSSFLSCSSGIPSSSGMCITEGQKPCQVGTKNDTTASSSRASGESCGRDDILRQDGFPRIWVSMNPDGKSTDPSSWSFYEQNVVGKNVQCHCREEIGRVSQFCKASSTCKAYAARNLRAETNKSNKWENVVAAAMSCDTIPNSNKFPDASNGLSMSGTDLSYGVASKDQLPSSSNCLRHLTMPVGRSKLEQQQTHADLNVPLVLDETKLKPHLMSMPISASILGNPSVIPEHDYIWQGGFEVQRSGRLAGFYDGIQAHLSTCASPKVLGVVQKFSQNVRLEEVSRQSAWPVQFHGSFVTEDSIALYFFATDLESYERNYKKLLENMLKNDLALKGNYEGIELLIFPSNCLPEKSQRWNRLFFFWAVFREKSNCSASPSSSQKKLCEATVDVEPLVQTRRTPVKAEVTMSQKTSMQRIMQKELSMCDRSPKELDAGKTSNVDLSSFSSSVREDVNCYTNASSLDQISKNFHECNKLSDGLLLSENSSFPSPEISTSAGQMTGVPRRCSLSRTMNHNVLLCSNMKSMLCSNMKSSSISPKEVNKIETQPDIQATNIQIGPGKVKSVSLYSDTFNWRRSALASISPDRQDASSNSLKIFSVGSSLIPEANFKGSRGQEEIDLDRQSLTDDSISLERGMQEEPIVEEQNIWELRSGRKHQFVNSSGTTDSEAVKILMKTAHTVTCCENKDPEMVYGENGYEKIKFSNDSRTQERILLRERSTSKMHGFRDKEQKDASTYEDRLKTTESYFFPVDPGPVRNLKSGCTIPWEMPTEDAKPLESDSPNLDLALGVEKKPLEQELLPLFFQAEDERSNQNKLLDLSTSDAGNEASASLSLSLALPFSYKKQTVKSIPMTEPLLPERRHVYTSLLLFGGLTDT